MSDTTETETETDTTDEPSKAELHERVEQLESTVEKLMPSRRDALRMGAAGLAGAAGLGAATQPAAASTGSAGDIGDPNNRPDLFADTVDANELTGSAGFIKTKTRAFLSSPSSANPIPLDSVTYDPDNNFDTSANEYIAPATGTYQVSANIRLENSVASGSRANFSIQVNGSTTATTELVYQSGFPSISVTDVVELTSGDSVSLSNLSSNNVTGNENNTFLFVIRLE